MSHLDYFCYKGVGERNREEFKYSQAVRVGDRIECSGQGETNLNTFIVFFTELVALQVVGTARQASFTRE